MKKTTVFTLAAVCGAFALALPDWKKPLDAAYPKAQYTLTNSVLTQTLAYSGCKTLKTPKAKPDKKNPGQYLVNPTYNDITLFDNGSYALFRYDINGSLTTIVTGSWDKVSKGTTDTFYLSINTASLDNLFGELETDGLANCKTNPKLASMTQLDILLPTTLVKKNTLVIKIKKGQPSATGTLQIMGKQHNDEKGTLDAVGTFSLKATLKGGVWAGPLII